MVAADDGVLGRVLDRGAFANADRSEASLHRGKIKYITISPAPQYYVLPSSAAPIIITSSSSLPLDI
jgi:hypothetical protein